MDGRDILSEWQSCICNSTLRPLHEGMWVMYCGNSECWSVSTSGPDCVTSGMLLPSWLLLASAALGRSAGYHHIHISLPRISLLIFCHTHCMVVPLTAVLSRGNQLRWFSCSLWWTRPCSIAGWDCSFPPRRFPPQQPLSGLPNRPLAFCCSFLPHGSLSSTRLLSCPGLSYIAEAATPPLGYAQRVRLGSRRALTEMRARRV